MQADAAAVEDVLQIRCGAHIINLMAQDTKRDTWIKSVHDRAVSVLSAAPDTVRLPKMIITRWNCLLRLIEDIVKKSSKPNSPLRLSDDDEALFLRGIENLRPLLKLTDSFQADSATLFDGFVGFTALLHASGEESDFGNLIETSVVNPLRHCMLQQDYIILMTVLCPGCERFLLKEQVIDRCLRIFLSSRTLFPPSASEALITAEFHNFVRAGRDVPHPVVSSAAFKKYWSDRSSEYPNLFHAVTVLLTIVPSEASVERVFSLLKQCFSASRSRAHDDGIFAQVQLKTLYHAMWDPTHMGSFTESDEDSEHEVDPDQPMSLEAVVKTNVMTTEMLATMTRYLNEGSVVKRRRIQLVNTCKYCPLLMYNHADGAERRFVTCCDCKGAVSVICVGCRPGEEAQLAARKDWKCRVCIRRR